MLHLGYFPEYIASLRLPILPKYKKGILYIWGVFNSDDSHFFQPSFNCLNIKKFTNLRFIKVEVIVFEGTNH